VSDRVPFSVTSKKPPRHHAYAAFCETLTTSGRKSWSVGSSRSTFHELGGAPVMRQHPSSLKTSSALRSGTSARTRLSAAPMFT